MADRKTIVVPVMSVRTAAIITGLGVDAVKKALVRGRIRQSFEIRLGRVEDPIKLIPVDSVVRKWLAGTEDELSEFHAEILAGLRKDSIVIGDAPGRRYALEIIGASMEGVTSGVEGAI